MYPTPFQIRFQKKRIRFELTYFSLKLSQRVFKHLVRVNAFCYSLSTLNFFRVPAVLSALKCNEYSIRRDERLFGREKKRKFYAIVSNRPPLFQRLQIRSVDGIDKIKFSIVVKFMEIRESRTARDKSNARLGGWLGRGGGRNFSNARQIHSKAAEIK